MIVYRLGGALGSQMERKQVRRVLTPSDGEPSATTLKGDTAARGVAAVIVGGEMTKNCARIDRVAPMIK